MSFSSEYDRELAAQASKSPEPAIALALERIMSEISEKCWCAGWMNGLEYSLWDMLHGGSCEYGMSYVDDDDIAVLRRLHGLACGWWVFGDDHRFLLTEDWLKKLEEVGRA